MTELYELPDGWRWAALAEVAEIGSSQVIPGREPSTLFNYIALENIEPGTGRLIDFSPTPGAAIASNKYRFTREHILYGKLRPYLRKALMPDCDGVSATDLLPLRPKKEIIDRRYLWQWLLSPDVLGYVTARQTGVKMPRLRTGDLQSMPVPLPPLAEQRRITDRVGVLTAQSRTAREALERVPALLKRFRQAVLAAAFRGELTKPDGANHHGRSGAANSYSGRKPRSNAALTVAPRVLPKGWYWATVGQQAEVVGGIQKTPARLPVKNSYPYLRVANVLRGRLNLGEIHRFELVDGELEKWRLKSGDVLIVEGNGSISEIGRCALWGDDIADCVHQNHIIRVRFGPEIDSPYFHYYLNSDEGRASIGAVASSTSGLYTLSVSKIQRIRFPVAPLDEQRRIVVRLRSLIAQATAIEKAAEAARWHAEHVDQAILARAFRGEL